MTTVEKQRFRSVFPNLNVDQAVVSGEVSVVYNCISWTVGFTDRWLWPGGSIANFDVFYRGFGFLRSGDGPIAAWGHSISDMTHGRISGPGHGPRWESKCRGELLIQHGLSIRHSKKSPEFSDGSEDGELNLRIDATLGPARP